MYSDICALSLTTKVALQWGIVFSEKDFESTGYPYEKRTLDPYPTQMSILEAMYNYMQKKEKVITLLGDTLREHFYNFGVDKVHLRRL